MTKVSASTTINASPERVRAVFLDWPNIQTWDKHYLKSFTILQPSTASNTRDTPDPIRKSGLSVVPSDRIHGSFWGGEAYLTILQNTETVLAWEGVWHGMKAVRKFEYVPVEEDGVVKTRFIQSEEAAGIMSVVLKVDGWMGGNLRKKFVQLNEDLRVFCEGEVKT